MPAPLLLVTGFTREGWLRPAYSVNQLEVSALSLGPQG